MGSRIASPAPFIVGEPEGAIRYRVRPLSGQRLSTAFARKLAVNLVPLFRERAAATEVARSLPELSVRSSAGCCAGSERAHRPWSGIAFECRSSPW